MQIDAFDAMNQITLYKPQDDVNYVMFAAGCFWGVQHHFQKQSGVLRTLVGYSGGMEQFPTYEEVKAHRTHHLETVLVEYDASKVDFETLCKLFFEIHDPGQTDGQGPDLGPQYLSGIFYTQEGQLTVANRLIQELKAKGFEVNTRVEPASDFWIAEDYHQRYYEKTGGEPYCHIRIKKF